jgi:hypothetical protein
LSFIINSKVSVQRGLLLLLLCAYNVWVISPLKGFLNVSQSLLYFSQFNPLYYPPSSLPSHPHYSIASSTYHSALYLCRCEVFEIVDSIIFFSFPSSPWCSSIVADMFYLSVYDHVWFCLYVYLWICLSHLRENMQALSF